MTEEVHVAERMYNAIQAGDLATFQRLFEEHPEERFYDDGRSKWFSDAASAGQLEIVQYLVATGVDVNEPANNDSVASPEGVVYRAAGEGHLDVVKWMLDHGAKLNFEVRGQTRCCALLQAARDGHLDVVKLLVERGAAVNSCWAEMTPLDHAHDSGQEEVAQYLKSVGAKTAGELG
jgi:ankyrin repeat protein